MRNAGDNVIYCLCSIVHESSISMSPRSASLPLAAG